MGIVSITRYEQKFYVDITKIATSLERISEKLAIIADRMPVKDHVIDENRVENEAEHG